MRQKRALRLLPARRSASCAVVQVEGTYRWQSRSLPHPIPAVRGAAAGSDSVPNAAPGRRTGGWRSGAVCLTRAAAMRSLRISCGRVCACVKSKPVVVQWAIAAASAATTSPRRLSGLWPTGTLTRQHRVVSLRPITRRPAERRCQHLVLSVAHTSGSSRSASPPTDDGAPALRELISPATPSSSSACAKGVNISAERLEPIDGGRIWLGQEALELAESISWVVCLRRC